MENGQKINKCITVHQPWATLLVMGHKKLESRTWKTNYRGILWIHSSMKPSTNENLAFAKKLYPNVKLPTELPLGSIIGSVQITDVLDKKQYVAKYKKEDCLYDYAWLCINARLFKKIIPFKGQQSIYNLPYEVMSKLAEADFEK